MLLLNELADELSELIDDPLSDGKPNAEVKRDLFEIALRLGPDRCQALYHAVVYMTKVA